MALGKMAISGLYLRSASARAADDVDLGFFSVEDLDSFADVTHADAGAFADETADGSGGGAAGFDAYAVVFDFEE